MPNELRHAQNIFLLTGAGMSAESGLGTFRDSGGLWAKFRIEDVCTPEAFQRNPKLVHEFYNMRRDEARKAQPNAAHVALARLETALAAQGRVLTLVTQNVDDLHERAGSRKVIHMHGELESLACLECRKTFKPAFNADPKSPCPLCANAGGLRPDIVWFGEYPYHLEEIESRLQDADAFIAIGTSGNVYPAAGFVEIARDNKAFCVEVNLEEAKNASLFTRGLYGPATACVPRLVEDILGG